MKTAHLRRTSKLIKENIKSLEEPKMTDLQLELLATMTETIEAFERTLYDEIAASKSTIQKVLETLKQNKE
jgi:hypothetical protein